MATSFPVYFNDMQQRCAEALPSDFPNKTLLCNLSQGLETKFEEISDSLDYLRKQLSILQAQNANLNVTITNMRGQVPQSDIDQLKQVSTNYEKAIGAIKSVIESMARVHNVQCDDDEQQYKSAAFSAVKQTPRVSTLTGAQSATNTLQAQSARASLPSSMTSYVAPSTTSETQAFKSSVPSSIQPSTTSSSMKPAVPSSIQPTLPSSITPSTTPPSIQPASSVPTPIQPTIPSSVSVPPSTPSAKPDVTPLIVAPSALPIAMATPPIVPEDTPVRKSVMAGPTFSQQYSQYPRPLPGLVQ